MKDRTLYGIISEIVHRETRYLRHYVGIVVNNADELNKGRVLCTVPALGRNTQDEGLWCYPRYQGHRQSTPAVGEAVEIYFMNGRIERPVYIGGAAELKAATLEEYDNQDTHVLFEFEGNYTKYDSSAQELEVKVATKIAILTDLLEIGEGAESFVLGDSLKTYLDNLKLYIDTHVHPGVSSGGSSTSAPASPSPAIGTVLSTKIKGE